MFIRNGRRAALIAVPIVLVVAGGSTAVALYAHSSATPRAKPPVAAPAVVPDAWDVTSRAGDAMRAAKQDILLEVAAVSITPDGAKRAGYAPAGSPQGEQRSWISMNDMVQHTATYAGPSLRYDFFNDAQRGYLDVDYAKHTYRAYRALVIGPGAPRTDRALYGPEEIAQLLVPGQLTVSATNQAIDGHDTIELAGAVPTQQEGSNVLTQLPIRIWVDATTYLPVRMQDQTNGGWSDTVDDTWLPATPANQALLVSSIPSGFSKAP